MLDELFGISMMDALDFLKINVGALTSKYILLGISSFLLSVIGTSKAIYSEKF